MRCLWLTLADPEPRHNGQYVYSGGLIDSVAATGSEIEVLGLRRPDSPRSNGARDEHVVWWLPGEPLDPLQSRWGSLASLLPHTAYRCRTAEMQRVLHQLLERGGWDGIVFDGISVGWALAPVRAFYGDRGDRPRLIYVSHNHEESLRHQVAESQRTFFRRQAVRLDASKVARLEGDLVDQVDFVTAITPEDLKLYERRRGDKPMGVLTPGYRGRKLSQREITGGVPRRAVIIGSFDWIAKRMNLEEFVQVADPIFAEGGAELVAVGSAEERFLKRMRERTKASQFTGTVPDLTRYMDEARIAIVPERNGGGFKLKVLEYVFNRIPVFALQGSFAGVPLVHGDSVMLYPDHQALARGVLDSIDDVERLNRLQERAYSACRDRFDWASRGRQILSVIAS
ncbi:MAG: glycosyltransferase [Reyranellales bacterium]|jgi:glycosyltransferase involved in cell wall biosynthesis